MTKIVADDTTNLSMTGTIQVECNQPYVDNIIVHADTVVNNKNYQEHTIKSFDSKGRLIKIFTLYESNADKIYSSVNIYDTAGHLIYEDKTDKFIRWHCYSYKYDANGHLISKTGYSSGEMGIKVTYIYEGDKLIKEITEKAGQKSEKVY